MTDTDRIRLARIALGCLAEPGNRDLHRTVTEHGPVEALERLVRRDDDLGDMVQARLGMGDPWGHAERRADQATRRGLRIATPEEPDWPIWLNDLANVSRVGGDRIDRDTFPPHCLWVRGTLTLADALARSVAIVGARAASAYGSHVAGSLGYDLADRDWAVVSGGAFGIDAAAHRGALSAGGVTVAVLACGLDRSYPLAHTSLFDRIAEEGLVISEWPPGAEAHKHRFLVRNRVIAALTRGTVMVEAAARSGARQTLGRALALGRRAMAVPGPVTSATSVGCHEALRRDGIRLVTGAPHVLEEIGSIGEFADRPQGAPRAEDDLDDVEKMLVDAVPRRAAATLAEVASVAGVSVRVAAAKLPSLVTRGVLTESANGYRLAR